ncbi:MAG TPA: response regulator transcription factor [Candidatus Polarisedimenticolaceae bacterium]|nr:response regulator transcription factor [Candidatus Polarisedimenticolaceae bacterium]
MEIARRTRLLFVDDRVEFRRLFELFMEEHPDLEIVGMSARATGLEEKVSQLQPDVVVLDISMPGEDPLEVMSAIKQSDSHVRFLVFSLRDDEATIGRALAAGADGYAVKEGSFEALAQTIRKVARGESVIARGGATSLK